MCQGRTTKIMKDPKTQSTNSSAKPIYSYGDEQAVDDGVLVPFKANDRDTGHRITSNAYEALKDHYSKKGYEDYDDPLFIQFFFCELLPLVKEAVKEYEKGGILKTNYDFKVRKDPPPSETLWYVPNERNGVTIMKPEDY
jgi:hypothetical protein